MRRLVAREGRRRRYVVRYSLKNAADAAGFYNDIGLDCLAREHPTVAFVHAAPVRNERGSIPSLCGGGCQTAA